MFVVTRTFRDRNGVFSAGSIIEPAEIYSFKSRLQQRHIVDVSEQDIVQWGTYFLNRFGIDIREKLQEYINGTGANSVIEEPNNEDLDNSLDSKDNDVSGAQSTPLAASLGW